MSVAVVTGGSRGIGRACAEGLAADGLAVAVGYRGGREEAEKLAARIEESGGQARAVGFDVTSPEQVAAAFAEIADALGPVSVLVNAAGVSRDGLLLRYPLEAVRETLEVNLVGSIVCAQQALRPMLRARSGRIVNVASAVALRGNPGQTAYAASKAGLLGMTRTLAREIGGRGVTVNAVCPGLVETDMTRDMDGARREALLAGIPAGRAGTPEDVAGVVRFLASPASAYVNGAVIAVDGGLTA